jgi:uncharacterized heparinase superfamily protein
MNRLATVARLFRTLRHLQAGQLLTQVIRRVQAKCPFRPPVGGEWTCSDADRTCVQFRKPSGASACLSLPEGRFLFIGEEKVLGFPIDWGGGEAEKLWAYNLHYFEWIWGLQPGEAKAVCDHWISNHQGSNTSVGWEPYPLSLRIQNWCAYWQTRGNLLLQEDATFKNRLAVSLGQQSLWLSKRLERHILANHFLENGVALYVAGQFLQGDGVDRFRSLGWKIVQSQLREQVLADGMHFERSPMYHLRVTYLVEMMEAWANEKEVSFFTDLAARLRRAASWMMHPDGEIALFNDSAFGIYPPVNEPPCLGPFALPEAGYYGARSPEGHYLICDAGALGPRYQPGHAHCDALSFEWSFFGKRLITDTGTSTYLPGSERLYERSTAAHNTWAPGLEEQGEIWSAFRLGRRPDVRVHTWEPQESGGFKLEASHDGFCRKALGSARHMRSFRYDPAGSLKIEDRFTGNKPLRWKGHFHFHPDVKVSKISSGTFRLECGGKELRFSVAGSEDVRVKETMYAPHFHYRISRACLELTCTAACGIVTVKITW